MADVLVSILVLLAYMAICYATGRLLVSWTATDPSIPIRTGAPLLGGAALGLELWLFGSIHVPWNQPTLLIPWLVAAIVSRRRFAAALADDWRLLGPAWREVRRLHPLALILMVVGVVIALTYLLNLLTQPITGIDALSMWMYKAKLYYTQQAVDLRPIAHDDLRRNLDYPPMLSLMFTTLYTLMGRVDDLVGKAVNFLFFAAGAATFLAFVRTLVGRELTMILTFLLVAMPLFASSIFRADNMGWADYPLGIWMVVSLIYLLEGVSTGRSISLVFAVIAAAMAALTKNEGLSFLIIILALLGYRVVRRVGRNRGRPAFDARLLAVSGLALLPVLLWQLYLKRQGFEHAQVSHWGQLLALLPGRTVAILTAARHAGLPHLDYPWMGLSFVLTSLMLWVRRPHFAGWAYTAVLGQGFAYVLAWLLTPYDLTFIVGNTIQRVLLQLAPSFVLLIAAVLAPDARQGSPTASGIEAAGQRVIPFSTSDPRPRAFVL